MPLTRLNSLGITKPIHIYKKKKKPKTEKGVGKYFKKFTDREFMCEKVFLSNEFLVLQAHLLEVHSENLKVTFDLNPSKRKSVIWKYARRVNEFLIMCELCGKL